MKNKLKEIWKIIMQGTKKTLSWIYDHKYKTTLLLVVLILVIVGIDYLFSIKYHMELNVDTLNSYLEEALETIPNDSGEVVVYENETKKMLLNTKTTNITIVDKATGQSWDTVGVSSIDDKGNVPESSGKFASPFEIVYLREDGSTGTMNAYNYSVRYQTYTINKIENGVQITYKLQDRTVKVFEHLPKKISYARYESEIFAHLQGAVDSGLITQKDMDNFTMLWGTFYTKNVNLEAFVYSVSSLPPVDSINLMIKVLDAIGYNQDKLVEDNSSFGESTPFEVKTVYTVVVETMLEGDDLVVKVPTSYLSSNNEIDQIKSISVYPYFGNVTTKSVDNTNPGFMFVPDGAGALIQLNSYNPDFPTYTKNFYNNNAYDQYYLLSETGEKMNMPVFGMYSKPVNSESWKGFLAIIENGAELAKLKASSADKSISLSYNQINTEFDVVQTSSVLLYGYYAEDTTSHLAVSQKYDYNAVVRYKLLVDETINYYDLANVYQDYLIEQFDLEKNFTTYEPKVFIDLIGTTSVLKQFMGVPYQGTQTMTTFDEAITILEELKGVNKVVNYMGAVNNGLNQNLISRVDFTKESGQEEGYNRLKEYLEGRNENLFIDLNFLKVYGEENSFNEKMGLYALDNKPLTLYKFNVATKRFKMSSDPYQILSPAYLSSVVDKFIKENDYFNYININDLGNTYLVDYNKKSTLSPFEGSLISQNNLEKLNQYTLTLEDPYMENIQYADYVSNISRESSNLYLFKYTVPFKQLVMNGLVEYITTDVNYDTAQNSDYYVLQALELGSQLKYTLSYEDTTLLKDTEYNDYTSTKYTTWVDNINSVYDEITDAYDQIGTNEIVDHELLAQNVYQTTYQSGVKVMVNYNLFDVEINGVTIAALDYLIVKE